ncbi:MAG TPA: helix-turn-helix domain-containing protein [Bryobacteraceae bacterium]
MGFETLQQRLLERVNSSVRNGDLTERGFARMIGISQPHMHHILKGARGLSVETADRILRLLDLSVEDLLAQETLCRESPRRVRAGAGDRLQSGGVEN